MSYSNLTQESLAIEPLAQARTVPAEWYVDTGFHLLDQNEIFAQSWQYVGHLGQIPETGDAIVDQVAGNPVVVVRDPESPLGVRAFYNVCLHRAGPLALRGDKRKVFQCQYHGWTYFLNGMLRGVPDWDRVELFNKEDYGLRPVSVDTWQGLIFVNLAEDPQPLDEVTKGIAERIAPLRLDNKCFYRRDVYEMACNWKVYVDNYLEGYHIPIVHPELNKILDYRQYVTETAPWYTLQTSPFQNGGNVYTALGSDGNDAFYYCVFPNFMLNILPGRLQTNVVVPVAHDRCRVIFDYFYDEAVLANDEVIQQEIAFSDFVQREDEDICEQVQVGLNSKAYTQGRYSVKREEGVYHFHSLLRERYRSALQAL